MKPGAPQKIIHLHALTARVHWVTLRNSLSRAFNSFVLIPPTLA